MNATDGETGPAGPTRHQRGEGSFVAVRLGRSNDPRETLTIARHLKIERAHALGFLVLWEELILEAGDALTGRVRGYRPEHVAEKLGWKGRPQRLIEALRLAGVLKTQRGTLLHPFWLETPTGEYARRRAALRQYDRKRWHDRNKPEHHTDSVRSPGGAPRGVDTESGDQSRSLGTTPQPPPGGGGVGFARWDWMLKNHKTCIDSRACVRFLDVMSDESWEVCQYALGSGARHGPSSSQKKRALRANSLRFLGKELFLLWRQEWVEKLDQRAVGEIVVEINGSEAQRERDSKLFYEAQMAPDSGLTDADRERIRRRWEAQHPTEATT